MVPPPAPASVAMLLVFVSEAFPGVPPARLMVIVPVLARVPEPDSVMAALVVFKLLAEPLKVCAAATAIVPDVASSVALPDDVWLWFRPIDDPFSPRVPKLFVETEVVIAPAEVTLRFCPDPKEPSDRAVLPLFTVMVPPPTPASKEMLLLLVSDAAPGVPPARLIVNDAVVMVPEPDSEIVPPEVFNELEEPLKVCAPEIVMLPVVASRVAVPEAD